MTEAPGIVLITGATDGIGLALARHYQACGAQLVLVGRRPLSGLDPQLFSAANYCQTDLSTAGCAAGLVAFLQQQGIDRLDLLIHNAGMGSYGPPGDESAATISALLAVNLRAPVELTHALLPWLARARGRLVFISSVAAALPTADYAVYGATKAALDGFARSLRPELAGRVAVQVIHPGATRSGMHAKIGAPVNTRRYPAAERTAAAIAAAITRGGRATRIGAANRVLWFAGRNVSGLVDRLARRRRAGVADSPVDSPPHALITGAAAGIGLALARHYAAQGWRVTGIDRTASASDGSDMIVADLAMPAEIARVVHTLAERPPIDLLVHNAGINAVGRFAAGDLARQQAVIDVNLQAPLLLTAGLLREQRLAQRATIVGIASLSNFVSYPGAPVYAATKDGLAHYMRSLAAALAGRRITTLTVYPGPTRTEHARRYSPASSNEMRRMPPERLAALIAAAVARRRRRLVPGTANRLAALLGRFAPRLAEWAMRKSILDRL